MREGLTAKDDSLPGRMLEETLFPKQPQTGVPLAEMLPRYYQIRGWDAAGVPTAKTLARLGIRS